MTMQLDPNGLAAAKEWRGHGTTEQIIRAYLEAAPSPSPSPGVVEDVLAERKRQVEVEGWTPEHDDHHDNGELSRAAAAYAHHSTRPKDRRQAMAEVGAWPSYWPWNVKWWKPTDPRRDLIKAGALILAEIERLDRFPDAPQPKGE